MSDFDKRVEQRAEMAVAPSNDPLATKPTNPMAQPRGTIPNTMLVVSSFAFVLGVVFSIGVAIVALSWPDVRYQLGFFLAAWAVFHFGEFAVTAGWNRDKLSVDCAQTVSHPTNTALMCGSQRSCSTTAWNIILLTRSPS